jgi:decaprenylphospho-beta-D-ribofuranose 2-oxidase
MGSTVTLTGWGRIAPSSAELAEPSSVADAEALLKTATPSRPLIPRGLGRSYNNAAQCGGGVVVSSAHLNRIIELNPVTGVADCAAGVSLEQLMVAGLPAGWFVPVSPGTRQVTIGGAIAADVHGKNHHVDGSFANHILEMRLITPVGAVTVSPTRDPELFWATVGGMGLTGVVSTVTMRMLRIETDQVLVDTERFSELDGVMSAMSSGDAAYRYSVAWVDCMTRGAHMGRAVLTRGDHAARGDVDAPSLRGPKAPRLFVPFNAPSGLLNPLTVKAFNEVWYRSSPRRQSGEAKSLSTFFHPLDGVRDWNRLYGRRGFVQYQFCVPDSAGDTVVGAIDRLSSSGVASFVAVL